MRDIDFTKPLDEDDVEYVIQRPWLATNAGYDLASLIDDDIVDDEDGPRYDQMRKAELIEEADRRGLDSSGTVADLIERLTAADNDEG